MNEQRLYGILPPGASRLKHKERESLHPAKRPPPRETGTASTTVKTSTGSKGLEITSSNKLLAGYMAHEFRTKGTVLGQKFDGETAERGKILPVAENESYKEITSLLMMKAGDGGAHIPGVVNPSQVARWIQM